MPKNLCTLMMLAATDSKGRLHRMIPGDMSYPEKQSYELYKKGEIVPTQVKTLFFYFLENGLFHNHFLSLLDAM